MNDRIYENGMIVGMNSVTITTGSLSSTTLTWIRDTNNPKSAIVIGW